MKRNIETFRYSFIGLAAALLLFGLAAVFDWDVFEAFVSLVQRGEDFEIDEIILPLAFVLIGVASDATLNTVHQRNQQDKLELYNRMSGDLVDEISSHLTKLLEFRLELIESAPQHLDIQRKLDIIIVQSFKHFERAQRHADIEMSLLSLATSTLDVSNEAIKNDETRPPVT